MKQEFFASTFQKPGEMLRFAAGKLTPRALAKLQRKALQLVADFDDLDDSHQDSGEPADATGRSNICLLVAFRPYVLSAISRLRKP